MAGYRRFSPFFLRRALRRMLIGPQALAFLPALALGAFWLGGEAALIAVALGTPLLVALAGSLGMTPDRGRGPRDGVTGLPLAAAGAEFAEAALASAGRSGLKTAAFGIEIEALDRLARLHGQDGTETLMQRLAGRLRSVVREGDGLFFHGDGRFAVIAAPVPRLDLENGIQIATRLQSAVEEPLSLDGQSIYLTAAVGFCLSSRNPGKSGPEMIKAAALALGEARRAGPSAIRAFSPEMGRLRQARDSLVHEAQLALEHGQILPWYQPQISTETGRVTGFEALARWVHPERGVIPPGEFLPALEQADQLERLGEVMVHGALSAINAWDAAGVDVPCVAVNMTGEELRNPRLADKLRWDLDRFDLGPDRLTIEVLETVVAGAAEDMTARNIRLLSDMGCRVDLDDFGTGQASIAAIRRFAIGRIKIDRSFVSHVDSDPEQQRMVAAILTMADRLGLQTLAEGVETAGEHAMLAQLGCHHVQGFGIGRPMPFDQTLDWIRAHEAKLGPPPRIGRQSG
ncbi:putative bifunctional diguanylate cyclase/phosphodiesterase [Marimonas lutisalis]|uniref:putative bifunctional diguanylate cyclase/phosphodiesterase n=1 Tax=Marimonas lutisalis TaxID=2545756 RepID=UPI001F3D7411|nr:bifunctional diguanylate cyclase/phosphodiesterase [Marimonas lutisalis]